MLVDLTPEALIERLREGKIYPAERVDSALNSFFRIENLAALREVALRQVAQDVESKRLEKEPVGRRDDRLAESAATQAVGERLLALIKPTPRPSDSCAAPGAPRSDSAPSSISSGSSGPVTGRAPRSRISSTRSAGSPRCWARI